MATEQSEGDFPLGVRCMAALFRRGTWAETGRRYRGPGTGSEPCEEIRTQAQPAEAEQPAAQDVGEPVNSQVDTGQSDQCCPAADDQDERLPAVSRSREHRENEQSAGDGGRGGVARGEGPAGGVRGPVRRGGAGAGDQGHHPVPHGLCGGQTAEAADDGEDALTRRTTEDEARQGDQDVRNDSRAGVGDPARHGERHIRAVSHRPGGEVLVAEQRAAVPAGQDQCQQHERDRASHRRRTGEIRGVLALHGRVPLSRWARGRTGDRVRADYISVVGLQNCRRRWSRDRSRCG